jgi:2-oxoglutarate ferredoxin oxidoreductase subunit alpha
MQKDVSIVLCGAAGQGIQTVEKILVKCLKLSGYHVFATKEYMSRVRGGSNSTELRISSKRVSAYVDRIDILVPFDEHALNHVQSRISSDTVILGDEENIFLDAPVSSEDSIIVPFSRAASEIGGKIFINIIAVGVIAGLFRVEQKILTDFIQEYFSKKSKEIIEKNILAIKKGSEIGSQLLESGKIRLSIEKKSHAQDDILINGAEAVSMGAIAGGCNFLSSYPMSPSTGVMVFLAQHADEFGLVVEQAEDEISAINMALGASYAGARALVTTSGGGFSLMTEGVSLAGMIETPVVIHVAQRPGPATGLPTRTEQADLELVLYSGHGEFPRAVFAPGNLTQAFELTQRAFNLADKFQIPVFILTDQYLMDGFYNLPPLKMDETRIEKHIVKTSKEYKSYALTENGVSPRGIPGFGDGLVGVDSDEHDEEAHITENLELRTKMVDKRLKKLGGIKQDVIPPKLIGKKDYKTLIIGWGSTFNPIKEALDELEKKDAAFLHFGQVYPLYEEIEEYLKRAQQRIIIENNATSQFAKLIKLQTGIEIENKILKYSGLSFSVEEIVNKISQLVK